MTNNVGQNRGVAAGFLTAARSVDPPLVPNRRRVPTPTNAFHIDMDSVS
jgi:hypothetical protein